jgi:hypothetical protein
VNATCRVTGAAKNTVLKLLAEIGEACAKYHDEHVRGVAARRVQCDEIWSFVGMKQKTCRKKSAAILAMATLGPGRQSTPIQN